jgi:hypothetical protein
MRICKIITVPHKSDNLVLVCKWGCHGASGHSQCKQDDKDDIDSSIFLSSLVPLQMFNDDGIVICKNPRPFSTWYCSLIRFHFVKETETLINSQVDEELPNLTKPTCSVGETIATGKYDLHRTLIDGKVCNVVSNNKSTHRCNITRFWKYAKDTVSCFVDLYDWYNMSPTVHKLLIHSADIIDNAVLPIGQLSEEVQEARNKDIKRLREPFQFSHFNFSKKLLSTGYLK